MTQNEFIIVMSTLTMMVDKVGHDTDACFMIVKITPP
jgi:hypothetical protein